MRGVRRTEPKGNRMPRADVPWSSFYLTLPTTLKDRVLAEATKDHRSMSQWVQVLLIRHFEAKDAECGTLSSESSSGTSDSDSVSSPSASNPTTGTKGSGNPKVPFNPPWLHRNGGQ